MKPLAPLALALSLAFSVAHADDAPNDPSQPMQVGMQLMQSNAHLLRNGDNVWVRVREGFQLTEVDSELVRRHETPVQRQARIPQAHARPQQTLSVSHHE